MHRRIVRNYLIACCLFSSSLFAQNQSPVIPDVPEQNIALQDPSLTESTDSSDTEATSAAQNGVPASNPQDIASGTASSTVSGSSSGSASPSGTGSAAGSTTYVFPSNGRLNRYWLRNTLGPKAWMGAGFTASWNTWVNTSPKEWHRDGTGWSKRFGTSLLDNGINTSVLVNWSRAMHQDPMYRRCYCSGTWARTSHAIKMSFMSPNRSGNLTFSPAKLVSPFTGPLVTRNTIYPDSFGSGDAARGGAYYLAGSVGWNLFREFVWNVFH